MNNRIISNPGIKRLLISHSIFVSSRVFFEIFLNIYIWKQTENLALVAWFNIFYLLFHVITFHGFAQIVKKGKVHLPRVFALLGYALVYLAICLMKDTTINYVIPIAIAIGIFNGMYWISYQTLRFDLTHSGNRGNYTGLENGLKLLVRFVMPVLGGAIITANIFNWGYSSLFLFGTILFLVALIIGNVKFPVYNTSNFHIKNTFSILKKDKDIMKSMLAHFFSSFSRGGTLVRLILPLLIFDIMKNELGLGIWLSFFSIVAIANSFAFGKLIKRKYYKKLLLSGGIFYSILIVLLILFPSFWVYILFGALIKIIETSIDIPERVISENLIHSLDDEKNNRIEYIVIREWFNIGFGRIGSFIVLLTVAGLAINQMEILLLLIAVAVLIEVFLISSIKRKFI